MKDAGGVVLYVGKAKNLRSRASHYFTKAAADDPRTADLVKLIADLDYLQAETEVDALLLEARLVKDILVEFLRDGGSVILTTHILEVAERLAEQIGIMSGGRLIAEGTMDQLRHYTGQAAGSLEDIFLQLIREEHAAP